MKIRIFIRIFLLRHSKSIFFSTPLWRYFLPLMKFDMTVSQLKYITDALASVKNDGAVLEIGVGGGATSIIMNHFMREERINRTFYAIDTFFGFTNEDVLFEQQSRGKKDDYLYYRSNKKEWYSKTLIAHGIKNAKIYQADAKQFDYSIIGPLAFCLFDVDLFKPTEHVLPLIYNILVPGGIIIVDDCCPKLSIYDGAGEAYRNFCTKMGFKEIVINEKLGIIQKPID